MFSRVNLHLLVIFFKIAFSYTTSETMQIVHTINHFSYTIFPDLQGKSNEDWVGAFEVCYSYQPYKPKISVLNDMVAIDANVPGKKFSGSHLPTWCYVSWAMAIPEMVASLQIPFGKEYDIAKGLVA